MKRLGHTLLIVNLGIAAFGREQTGAPTDPRVYPEQIILSTRLTMLAAGGTVRIGD